MTRAMDFRCPNCGELIGTSEQGLLTYMIRAATESECRSFLVVESGPRGSSLRHRCELAPDHDADARLHLARDPKVGQACGMISVQAGCSCGNAIALLEARASGTHQSLAAVAAAVLERRTSFA